MKYLIRFFRIFSGPDANDCRRFCISTQKRESTGEYIDETFKGVNSVKNDIRPNK